MSKSYVYISDIDTEELLMMCEIHASASQMLDVKNRENNIDPWSFMDNGGRSIDLS